MPSFSASWACDSPALSLAAERRLPIDGYIGEIPVSIKLTTYKSKNMLQEKIDLTIIYYDKVKDGIKVESDF